MCNSIGNKGGTELVTYVFAQSACGSNSIDNIPIDGTDFPVTFESINGLVSTLSSPQSTCCVDIETDFTTVSGCPGSANGIFDLEEITLTLPDGPLSLMNSATVTVNQINTDLTQTPVGNFVNVSAANLDNVFLEPGNYTVIIQIAQTDDNPAMTVYEPFTITADQGACPCDCETPGLTQLLIPVTIQNTLQLEAFVAQQSVQTPNVHLTRSNYCFRLQSNLLINNYVELTNCEFKIPAGRRIEVNDQFANANFNKCTFSGCTNLWQGFVVKSGPINFNSTEFDPANACVIRDALFGISSEAVITNAVANINITNTLFQNNFVGILKMPAYLPVLLQINLGTKFEGGVLLPSFSGAYPLPLAESFAGIVWNKVANFSLNGSGNLGSPITFKNLHNGIILNDIIYSIQLSGKLRFENIGLNSNLAYSGPVYWLAPFNNLPNQQVTPVMRSRSAITTSNCGGLTYIGEGPTIPNFVNTFNGITSMNDWDLRVQQTTFNGVTGTAISHVSTFPSNVDIRNNTINDYYTGHGIQVLALSQANTGLISGNKINGTDPANPNVKQAIRKAIFVGGYNGPTPIRVYNNEINRMHYGVWGLNCDGLRATDNTVNNTTLYNCEAYGLLLENSQYTNATCNRYFGTDAVLVYFPNPPGNTQHYGMYLKKSPNTTLKFNGAYDSEYGIFAKDLNSSSDISYNAMNNHRYGIYIDLNSQIGDQGFSRNTFSGGSFQKHAVDVSWADWYDTYGGANPFDPNNPAPLHSTFKYRFSEPSTAATLTTPEITNCTQNYFYTCISDPAPLWPSPQCKKLGKSYAGNDEKERENDASLFDKMAKNELSFSEFEETYTADAKRYLTDRMDLIKETLADTGIYATFYSSLAQGKEKLFNETDTVFIGAGLDTTLINYLDLLSDSIGSKLYQIFVLDSLHELQLIPQATYENNRQALFSLIEQIQQDHNNQLQILYKPDKAETAQLKNESIITDKLLEQYEKTVNEIYFGNIARGNLSVSQTQLDDLILIAGTCPKIGGTAVFKARSLVTLFVDSLFFDDDSLCFQQGVQYRLAHSSTKTVSKPSAVIYPNPASDRLFIRIEEEVTGPINVSICNTLGQRLWLGTISGQEAIIQNGISELAAGSYFVELTSSNGTFHHISKFIKLK